MKITPNALEALGFESIYKGFKLGSLVLIVLEGKWFVGGEPITTIEEVERLLNENHGK